MEGHQIDTLVSNKKISHFPKFDEFFSRKLTTSAHTIAVDHQEVVFPCDGRHLLVEDLNDLSLSILTANL
jgi:phosphatidylserine decarboxylase